MNGSLDSIRCSFLERWYGYSESSKPVGSVQGAWYRLFREELDGLADQLSGKKSALPAITEDQIVQLLAVAAMLLRQHRVNKRGQCKFCGGLRWKWRLWSRRPPCTVYRTVTFVMGQGLDEVWCRLFESLGKERSLIEVREWMKGRTPVTTCIVCGETASGGGVGG